MGEVIKAVEFLETDDEARAFVPSVDVLILSPEDVAEARKLVAHWKASTHEYEQEAIGNDMAAFIGVILKRR